MSEKLKLAVIEERLLNAQDEMGHEIPDPQPMVMPAGFRRPETLAEQVARLVKGAVSRMAEEEGAETFEESEDFDVDDDFDPRTPYEEIFDPTLNRSITPDEMRRNGDRYREMYLSSERNRFRDYDNERRARAAAEAAAVATKDKGEPARPAPSEPPVDK